MATVSIYPISLLNSKDKVHVQHTTKSMYTTYGENASLKQRSLTPDDVIIKLPGSYHKLVLLELTAKFELNRTCNILRSEIIKNAPLKQHQVTCDGVTTMTMQLSCWGGLHACAYQN